MFSLFSAPFFCKTKYSLSPEFHNVTFSFTQGTSLTLLQELKAGKVERMIPGGHHHQLLLNNRNKIDIWLIGNIRADRQIIRWPVCMNMKSTSWRRFIIPISIFQKIAAYVRCAEIRGMIAIP
jgi:hypothetical protein